MKNPSILIPYRENQDVFLCPVCRSAGSIVNASYVCEGGHCYDISAKGYLNFGPAQDTGQYSRALFESRREMLSSGLFAPVADTILEIAANAFAGRPITTLDAGCGEGYFACVVGSAQPGRVVALDMERSAVQLACKRDKSICWLVADNNRLPIADKKIDLLLNILTPANYAEFRRVLRGDGLLVKVVPGADHLMEIRGLLSKQLRHDGYSNEGVLSLFEKNMAMPKAAEIRYRYAIDAGQAEALLRMTPMSHRKDLDGVRHQDLREVTVHLWILTGGAAR